MVKSQLLHLNADIRNLNYNKGGNRYIEAVHIKPKYMMGREIPDNIILLC
jgi:hypothetical protein